jgi:hypothetical protein
MDADEKAYIIKMLKKVHPNAELINKRGDTLTVKEHGEISYMDVESLWFAYTHE